MKKKVKLLAVSGAAICLAMGAVPFYTMPVQAEQVQETQYSQYYIFADSSQRLLEYDDVCRISNADIRVAKNEIYARHGRKFSSTDLQEYFAQMPWYRGTIEPDQFDENSLNEIERANVSFLDQEYQKGTGSYVSEANGILLRIKCQSSPFQSAMIDDKIGLDSFGERVSVYYKPVIANEEGESIPSLDYLGNFYRKDGEFYGNIGYRKSAGKVDAGNEYAWYDGHLYEAALESREKTEYNQYSDLFNLYEDNLKVAWCWIENELANGVQSTPYWLLTKKFIYASSYSAGMKVFDKNGNLTAQMPNYLEAIAAYNGRVYFITKDWQLMSADEGTLASEQILFQKVGLPSEASKTHFLIQAEDGLYAYDMENNTATWLNESSWLYNFVAGPDCAYIIQSGYSSDQCVIESISYDGTQREIVCVLDGISYGSLVRTDGNIIYMNVGPKEDFESPEGNINHVEIAIDLENGIVYVLGADWFA